MDGSVKLSSGISKTPVQESQVFSRTVMLSHILNTTEDSARQVYDRLSSVCRTPEDNVNENTPEDYLVPLADTLRDNYKQAQRINDILQTILDTIEL